MSRVRLYMKVVFGNRVLCGVYGVFIVLMFAKPVNNSVEVYKSGGMYLNEVSEAFLSNCFYLFAFCLLIAYESVHQIQSNQISECLQSQGNRRYYNDCFFLIMLHNFLLLIIVLLFVTILSVLCGRVSLAFILYVIKSTSFFFLVSGAIGSLLGFLCAMSKRKKLSVLLMFLLLFFFSPMFQSIILTSELTGIVVFRLLTSVFPSMGISPIMYYGYNVTLYQYSLALVWIGGLSVLFLIEIKKVRSLLAGIMAAVSLVGALGMSILDPGLISIENPKEGYLESYYYAARNEAQKNAAQSKQLEYSDSTADFTVLKYDMELSCFTQLRAKVVMDVSEKDTPSYTFTLYNRYVIDEITNENEEPLGYTREGNYVTVEAAKANTKIAIVYHGRGNPCYANVDGIYLRAGFPWYPVPGIHDLFDEEGGLLPFETAESEYAVKLNCLGDVYCNLEEQSKKSFYGTSNNLMIVQGLLTEKMYENVRYVYPIAYEYQYDIETCIANMSECIESLSTNNGVDKPTMVLWGNNTFEITNEKWCEEYQDFWLLPHGFTYPQAVMEELCESQLQTEQGEQHANDMSNH